MADITKCSNNLCVRNMECYRFLAYSSQLQSYCDFIDICNCDNGYGYFWDAKNKTHNLESIDLSNLKSKESIITSMQKALEDIEPIKWSEEVLTGKKKVVVRCENKTNKD